MESKDRELILKHMENDIRLKNLYMRHKKLDQEISKLANRFHLTSNDQVKQQKLKMQKLKGVEEMLAIVKNQNKKAA